VRYGNWQEAGQRYIIRGDQIQDEMDGACKTQTKVRNAYKMMVGKPKRRPLGRPRPRWEDNIMDLRELG
jgi:hypothetical protein